MINNYLLLGTILGISCVQSDEGSSLVTRPTHRQGPHDKAMVEGTDVSAESMQYLSEENLFVAVISSA